MTVWRMRIPYWIITATNTQTDYVILIVFPLQQCLQECSSVLSYKYIARLVSCILTKEYHFWRWQEKLYFFTLILTRLGLCDILA